MDSLLNCIGKNITVAGTLITCNLYKGASEIQNPFITKIYHLMIMVFFVLAGFLLYTEGQDIVQYVPVLNGLCKENTCDVILVYRLSLALFIFHMTLCILTYGLKSSNGSDRAKIQNASWQLKFPYLIFLLIGCAFIPEPFFLYYGWLILLGAILFIACELCIIINFAFEAIGMTKQLHELDFDNENNKLAPGNMLNPWIGLVVMISILCVISSLILIVYGISLIEYLHHCTVNFFIIGVYIVSICTITIFSLHPKIQKKYNTMGVFQVSVLGFYATFLLWNSIIADDPGQCTAEYMVGGTPYWITVIIGSLFAIVLVQYMSIPLVQNRDDEYNYCLVNFLYAISSMYITMLLTNWSVVRRYENGEVEMGLGWFPLVLSVLSMIFMTVIFIVSLVLPKTRPNENISQDDLI